MNPSTSESDIVRIALIGDYDPAVTAHIAIPKALSLAGEQLNVGVITSWIGTSTLGTCSALDLLAQYDGIWCVPASPYRDRQAALDAIRFARVSATPYLGTCGGFQHAVLEFAINVLGHSEADSIEDNPSTKVPLISQLACALREVEAQIRIAENSRLAEFFATDTVAETYNCSFGFNPAFDNWFNESAMQICARDGEDDPKAIEIRTHPFFIATAFQPERSALNQRSHALIDGFVAAAHRHSLNN